jgi:hypothetical protein
VKWIGTATDIDDERRSNAARRIADGSTVAEYLRRTVADLHPGLWPQLAPVD